MSFKGVTIITDYSDNHIALYGTLPNYIVEECRSDREPMIEVDLQIGDEVHKGWLRSAFGYMEFVGYLTICNVKVKFEKKPVSAVQNLKDAIDRALTGKTRSEAIAVLKAVLKNESV